MIARSIGGKHDYAAAAERVAEWIACRWFLAGIKSFGFNEFGHPIPTVRGMPCCRSTRCRGIAGGAGSRAGRSTGVRRGR